MKAAIGPMLATLLTCGALATDSSAHVPKKAPNGSSQSVPHHPSDGTTAATWCAMHMARREFDDAAADCDIAIAADPTNAQALSNRGSLSLVTGEAGKALIDFEAALRVKPLDATLYFNRGLAHAALGGREAAIRDYSVAIGLKPDLAIAYHNRGYEYEVLGQRNQAIADYRRALEIDPRLQPPRQGLKRLTGDL